MLDLGPTLAASGVGAEHSLTIVEGRTGADLPTERSLALVAVDADSVQRSILASPRPTTILGASKLLEDWDSDGIEECVGRDATVLFAGGGSATVLAPRRIARELAQRLERAFRERTKLTATTACVDVSPRELVDGPPALAGAAADLARLDIDAAPRGFGACLARLAFELRLRKGAERAHPFLAEPFDGLRCSQCALRPRASRESLCVTCDRRVQRGAREKGSSGQARSFEELFEAARRIAFICIDGKGIGDSLERLGTIGQYRRYSRALHAAFQDAFLDLVKEGRFQAVLRGGDDLLLVVPATADDGQVDALTLTAKILAKIESCFPEEPKVRAGAGVLITASLPADAAFGAARNLCNSAKRAITPGGRSAIDFEVVLGGATLAADPQSLRSPVDFLALGSAAKLRATQRPYTLDRFEGLLAVARGFKGRSRSQLIALRNAFSGDPNDALLMVQYQLARDPSLREALQASLASAPSGISPWVLNKGRDGEEDVWETALADIVDASRLVGGDAT